MKRTISILAFVFISVATAFAQYVVTPRGLEKVTPDDKEYYIIDVPELSQSELYTKTLQYITQTYVSPKDVITGQVENEMLTVNGAQTIFYDFKVRYKLVFQFKDGRVRFDMPSILSMNKFENGKEMTLSFTKTGSALSNIWIFNKKGELRGLAIPAYKEDIENLFNSLYNGYVKFLTQGSDNNDDNW